MTAGVAQTWLNPGPSKPVRLVAEARAILTHTAIVREPSDDALVEKTLAWRSGQIDLSGITLAQAADEFNRYNDIDKSNPDVFIIRKNRV